MELTRENLREEMKSFKSSLKEESISHSEKSFYLEKDGEVASIILDEVGTKANKLSTSNMLRLLELFMEIESDSKIGCIVFKSKKPTIFIAGADISEIERMGAADGDDASQALMKLQAVFTYLEKMSIPSIAAIHGVAVGGGLELALSCDYRMMTDAPETRVGLPEVLLGVIPGWGGTQRLPRLVGLEKSLDMILTGRQVDSRSAKKMGLVDKVVPKELLEQKAMQWARSLAKSRAKRRYDGSHGLMERVPGGKYVVFEVAKKKLLEKTKGNYPAPLKAIEVIKATYGGKLEKGLKVEAKAFCELVGSPESNNLINVFFLNDAVKKDKGTESGVAGLSVAHTAVVGAGVMGGGIAQLFAQKGVRVRLKDINWKAITQGFKTAHAIFAKRVKRKRMKPYELDNAMALIEGTVTYSGFKHTDLVVEAVVEDMEIKKKVFQQLETVVGEQTILASNTSSLSITELSEATKNPARVVGMHFFNPVEKMPLVEIIRGKHTSDEAVATIFQFSKKLGKTPVVVKDGPGFVVNRILAPYLNEAVFLLLDGVTPEDMDRVMEKFGMPMGPATLLDEIGLDIGAKVSKILYGAFGDRMKPPPFMEQVVKDGFLGKKVGKGIYVYGKAKGEKSVNQELMKTFKPKARDAKLTDEVVERRMTYLMVNEAARIYAEGLVRHVSDIDVAMIFGTGFAPFRGGLMRYADSVGAESIVSELEVLSRTYGERFKPCEYLQQLSVNGGSFYERLGNGKH